MPTTAQGLVYPDSTGHTRLWEHLQTLAQTADTAITNTGLLYVKPKYKRKATAESVTNSITLQDDDDFVFTIPANKKYLVQARLSVSGASAGDLRLAWAISGGVNQLIGRVTIGAGASTADTTDGNVRASSSHSLTTALQYGTAPGANANVSEDFMIETVTSAASGVLTMQWAQWVANATSTTLTASSYVLLTEIDDWT